MICRAFEDRATLIERCRDTLRDGRGLILPLDDMEVINMLGAIAGGERTRIRERLRELIAEVWLG